MDELILNIVNIFTNDTAQAVSSGTKWIDTILDNQIIKIALLLSGLLGLGVLIPPIRSILKNILNLFGTYIRVYKKQYYSEIFVLNNIKKAKKVIRIVCVRNTRISSPDILRSFKEFIDKYSGKIELLYLDPSENMNSDIIDKIRVTLPTPPTDSAQCRKEIIDNEKRMIDMIKTLDQSKQDNISLYRFKALPSIHLCQFDNKIYLGFQFFDPNASNTLSSVSLNDYCTIINAKTVLGKLLLQQIDYLRDKYSEKQRII